MKKLIFSALFLCHIYVMESSNQNNTPFTPYKQTCTKTVCIKDSYSNTNINYEISFSLIAKNQNNAAWKKIFNALDAKKNKPYSEKEAIRELYSIAQEKQLKLPILILVEETPSYGLEHALSRQDYYNENHPILAVLKNNSHTIITDDTIDAKENIKFLTECLLEDQTTVLRLLADPKPPKCLLSNSKTPQNTYKYKTLQPRIIRINNKGIRENTIDVISYNLQVKDVCGQQDINYLINRFNNPILYTDTITLEDVEVDCGNLLEQNIPEKNFIKYPNNEVKKNILKSNILQFFSVELTDQNFIKSILERHFEPTAKDIINQNFTKLINIKNTKNPINTEMKIKIDELITRIKNKKCNCLDPILILILIEELEKTTENKTIH
jgi:hypothetical protein